MTKKVLVSEKVAEECLEILRDRGYQVDVKFDMTPEELIETIPIYHALIVRSATKVTADVVKAGKKLKVIGRAGVGVDNIDIEAATEKGVIVCNAPTSNIVTAAEHTMTLMLACARHIAAADRSMKEGKWERAKFTGVELYQKTLAICGLGRVGCLVAERAKAFGMNIIAYDPYCSNERAESMGVMLYDTLDELLPVADFITVHLPKTKETIGMFGPDQYAQMKDGVILINAARGGIFNIDSLADFMAAGKIYAAGIDVWSEEPCTESPLHEFDAAILTPHIAAVTVEAQRRAGMQIADYVSLALSGSIVPTALNIAPVPPEVMDIVAPYIPACQMMGSMMAQMNGEVAKRMKITANGALAERDMSVLTAGFLEGMLSYRSNKKVTPVNAASLAKRHGIAVETISDPSAHEYASSITLNADGRTVSCTLSGPEQLPRVVELLGYRVEIASTGRTLIFEYDDAPGRIGIIGTVLGDADISINTMQIARKEEINKALVYMNVAQEVPAPVLDQLREKIKPDNLWYITL